jgi:hypothetical protein
MTSDISSFNNKTLLYKSEIEEGWQIKNKWIRRNCGQVEAETRNETKVKSVARSKWIIMLTLGLSF